MEIFVKAIFLFSAVAGALFFLLLMIYSILEKKVRAAILSFAFFVLLLAICFFSIAFEIIEIQLVFFLSATAFILLFFLPLGGAQRGFIGELTEKADERDTMFARAKYIEGSERYDAYYQAMPELKKIDDKIRKLPPLLEPGGKYYEPFKSEFVKSLFVIEEQNTRYVDGPVNPRKIEAAPVVLTKLVKEFALKLGASDVGVAGMNPFYLYSHRGIGPGTWGGEIINEHPFAVVYSLEMDWRHVEKAPRIEITEETANQYLNAQKISISLAQYIRDMGYSARAHVSGSDYQLMLPPLAYEAGLGEMSRMGYIVSGKHGARIRLGAITTGLPLIPDKPANFGILEFCKICKKCATNCPSGAIPNGGMSIVRGIEKWQAGIEKCYQYWRIIGTDCGVCMKVCPFSHPDTFPHKVLRIGVKRSAFTRKLAHWGDNLFYGKRIKID